MKTIPREVWQLLADAVENVPAYNGTYLRIHERYAEVKKRYKPQKRKYVPLFESKVIGIPCGIYVTHYSPAWQAPYGSLAAWEEPPEHEEFEFLVIDLKTNTVNDWLTSKLTKEDEQRILEEYNSREGVIDK